MKLRVLPFLLVVLCTLPSCTPLLQLGVSSAALVSTANWSSKDPSTMDDALTVVKVNRSSPYFASDLRKITTIVDYKPVDVVIAGVPPAGDGSVTGVTQADTSVDIELRETTYQNVIITKLTPELIEIRPRDQYSSKLTIPNFQIKHIALQEVHRRTESDTSSKLGYGLLIILCLILAGVFLLGDWSGSGMPPRGCMVTGGVIALLGAALSIFLLESASDPTNQKTIEEFVNRVWSFM